MSTWWVMIPVIITYIGSICALICCGQHKKVPTNYILLFVFTMCVSYIVGSVCIRVKHPKVVVEAACLTLGVVVGISLYAIFTKSDFTKFGPLLYVISMIFLIAGMFMWLWGPTGNLIFACFGVFLFSFYLAYDTQLIWGGKHR